MHIEVLRYQNQLDTLFKLNSEIGFNPKVHGEFAKYLCVRTSGYIESSVRHILTKFCDRNSSFRVQRRMEKTISRITNCNQERILEILGAFDSQWAEDYLYKIAQREKIKGQIKDSIDSVIDRRHSIAHGGSQGIGMVTVENYYKQCKIAIAIINEIVLGD